MNENISYTDLACRVLELLQGEGLEPAGAAIVSAIVLRSLVADIELGHEVLAKVDSLNSDEED